jgi:hypothetical protein
MLRVPLVLCLAVFTLATGPAALAASLAKCPAPSIGNSTSGWAIGTPSKVAGDTTSSIARRTWISSPAAAAIHELYEQTDGLIGDSILSFDPVRRAWQQTWVTNGGTLMVLTGVFRRTA